jgi:hypothetical protein
MTGAGLDNDQRVLPACPEAGASGPSTGDPSDVGRVSPGTRRCAWGGDLRDPPCDTLRIGRENPGILLHRGGEHWQSIWGMRIGLKSPVLPVSPVLSSTASCTQPLVFFNGVSAVERCGWMARRQHGMVGEERVEAMS